MCGVYMCQIIIHFFSVFASIGDEIDAQYECELKEIVELTGSPESAFKMFTEVARNLFEWDEQGGGMCHRVFLDTPKFFLATYRSV